MLPFSGLTNLKHKKGQKDPDSLVKESLPLWKLCTHLSIYQAQLHHYSESMSVDKNKNVTLPFHKQRMLPALKPASHCSHCTLWEEFRMEKPDTIPRGEITTIFWLEISFCVWLAMIFWYLTTFFVFFSKTPMYPGSSLPLKQSLRVIWKAVSLGYSPQLNSPDKYLSQLLGCFGLPPPAPTQLKYEPKNCRE